MLMASPLMANPRVRARTALRIAVVGLLTATVWAFAPLPGGALAVADGLPQELLGFRLGERIDAVKGSSGAVTVKSRPMIVPGRHEFSFAPPLTTGVILYQDCPVRVDTRCTPGPDALGDRPDTPGSLRLFVASFAEARLLGVAFELNKRRWGSTAFEKADELLRKSYGRPTKASPVKREITKTPQVQIVTASTSWQWEDSTVRLLVRGIGNNMPGTTIPGIGNPSYSYFLYLERVDLRRVADQRAPKRSTQDEK